MRFTCTAAALRSALTLVSKATSNRNDMPIFGYVRLQLANNQLRFTCANGDGEIVHIMPMTAPFEAGDITVPFKRLSDLAKGFAPTADIVFSVTDNKAQLKSGKSRYTLDTLPADQFPSIEFDRNAQPVVLTASALCSAFNEVFFACAQNDVRHYFNGVHLRLSNDNQLIVTATNGHMLARTCKLLDKPVSQVLEALPSRNAVELLLSALEATEVDAVVAIYLTRNHVRLIAGSTCVTGKLIDGQFPDVDKVIPQYQSPCLCVESSELNAAVSRLRSAAHDGKVFGLRLQTANSELSLRAVTNTGSESVDALAANYSGQAIEIGVNADYLTDVVGNKGNAMLQFGPEIHSSILVLRENNPGFKAVVMPMRL